MESFASTTKSFDSKSRPTGDMKLRHGSDTFMIAFLSARRTAQCAIAVQRSFAAHCERHPELPIRVRMRIHAGEAIILAARIAAIAQDNQILVSSTLHDLVANGGLRFVPMGEKQLKGFVGTLQIFEVI
jgi:class 3 adenylate cyclase